jgi:mercuric ion transport protein
MPWKQYLSVGVAILTCPCHLPILIVALAGTALGGWLSQHALVVILGMAGMFVLALLYSFSGSARPETKTQDRGQAGKET